MNLLVLQTLTNSAEYFVGYPDRIGGGQGLHASVVSWFCVLSARFLV